MRYEIRFTNNKGEVVITTIGNENELTKIIMGDAKNSIIESRLGNNMSVGLHCVITDHNKKIENQNKEEKP